MPNVSMMVQERETLLSESEQLKSHHSCLKSELQATVRQLAQAKAKVSALTVERDATGKELA